jgi:hypothetical protein
MRDLRLVQPVDRLGQGVVIAFADVADGGLDPELPGALDIV